MHYNTGDTVGGETLGSASVCQSSKTAFSFELEKESQPSTRGSFVSESAKSSPFSSSENGYVVPYLVLKKTLP